MTTKNDPKQTALPLDAEEIQRQLALLTAAIQTQIKLIQSLELSLKENNNPAKQQNENVKSTIYTLYKTLDDTKKSLKEHKDLLGFAGANSEYPREFQVFKMVNEILDHVIGRCEDVYKNFDKMSLDEKLYAVIGCTLMLAGTVALIAAIADKAIMGASVFQAICTITAGSYIASQATKKLKDHNAQKLHEPIVKLCKDLLNFVFAPVCYAYESFKKYKPKHEPKHKPSPLSSASAVTCKV